MFIEYLRFDATTSQSAIYMYNTTTNRKKNQFIQKNITLKRQKIVKKKHNLKLAFVLVFTFLDKKNRKQF